jgi:hypothetical protein
MTTPFTQEEASILVRLLLAHFIADFFLQTDKGVKDKARRGMRSVSLWKHIAIVTGLSALFLWDMAWWKQILLIGATHLLIDLAKLQAGKHFNRHNRDQRNLLFFVVDQVLHVLVIAFIWLWMIDGWDKMRLFGDAGSWYRPLLRFLAYVLAIGPVSYLIRFLTDKWATDLEKSEVGLKDAGMWIGYLERIIIVTLVFIGQFTAIGFLVAAKSILRLIDKPEAPKVNTGASVPFHSRNHTEYVLIGTFLSFTFALFIALATEWILSF